MVYYVQTKECTCVFGHVLHVRSRRCAHARERESESEKKTLTLEFAAVVPTMSLLVNAQCV